MNVQPTAARVDDPGRRPAGADRALPRPRHRRRCPRHGPRECSCSRGRARRRRCSLCCSGSTCSSPASCSSSQPSPRPDGPVVVASRACWGRLSLLVGLLCLRDPLQTLAVLGLLVGVAWTVGGIIRVVQGIVAERGATRGWRIASGVVWVVAGGVVLVYPGREHRGAHVRTRDRAGRRRRVPDRHGLHDAACAVGRRHRRGAGPAAGHPEADRAPAGAAVKHPAEHTSSRQDVLGDPLSRTRAYGWAS